MSDRNNRDIGRKKQLKKPENRWACGCWYCLEGVVKKREIEKRSLRKDKLMKFSNQLQD